MGKLNDLELNELVQDMLLIGADAGVYFNFSGHIHEIENIIENEPEHRAKAQEALSELRSALKTIRRWM